MIHCHIKDCALTAAHQLPGAQGQLQRKPRIHRGWSGNDCPAGTRAPLPTAGTSGHQDAKPTLIPARKKTAVIFKYLGRDQQRAADGLAGGGIGFTHCISLALPVALQQADRSLSQHMQQIGAIAVGQAVRDSSCSSFIQPWRQPPPPDSPPSVPDAARGCGCKPRHEGNRRRCVEPGHAAPINSTVSCFS